MEQHMEGTLRCEMRIKWIMVLFACLMMLMVLRFFQIQMISSDYYSDLAMNQYGIAIEGMDSRGKIVDRSGIPLTGGQIQYFYFLDKQNLDSGAETLLAAISARKISSDNNQSTYDVYRSQIFDEEINEGLKNRYNAYILSSPSRYDDDQIASHLIGYLNQDENRGVSGLEQAYEDSLAPGNTRVNLWADGRGTILKGIDPKREGGESLYRESLVTTLDQDLQQEIEETLEGKGLKGAVMVSEASTGEILAWASWPDFNPNRVEDYLERNDDCLVNKCIQASWPPGSVFKLVVAAAALEHGIAPPETFQCTGVTTVEGVELGCFAGPEEGHGDVDLEEAMAMSCNGYFALLGQRVGKEAILDMAGKLGFGEQVMVDEDGNLLFKEEIQGNLPDAETLGPWDISNLSIGQGDVLATPIQVQKLLSTIANEGVYVPLSIMKGPAAKGNRVISTETALTLQNMMEKVMAEGGGSGYTWELPVYGKTGTAEVATKSHRSNQCWFSGYCEKDSRKYVVTVSIEDGVSGSATAIPVFQIITNHLSNHQITI